jgi:ABC-2 type transport system permease protein
MFKRIWTIFVARNREFYRDKAGFGWNIIFPIFIIVGFGFIFGGGTQSLYKAGVVTAHVEREYIQKLRATKYVEIVEFANRADGESTLFHHKIDLLVDPEKDEYLINSLSPNGYICEIIMKYAASTDKGGSVLKKNTINKPEVPYIEWLFPGVLGMNMMFSALFGVGYVLVRYRKNGVLKRLSVTPLRAWEFLTAQVISRLFVIMITTSFIFTVVKLIYKFRCEGSYFDLAVVFLGGAFSLISIGLLIASRFSSEEMTDGILNFITFPMMFMSEVWFSLEGTSPWVKTVSKFFPLTHITEAARRIMNEGASLYDVRYNVAVLFLTGFVLLIAGSLLFKWDRK